MVPHAYCGLARNIWRSTWTTAVPRIRTAMLCVLIYVPLLAAPSSLNGQVPWWVFLAPAVREQGVDSVYQVLTTAPDTAVWIPTPSALDLMGYPPGSVNVVAPGTLAGLTKVIIRSLSPTPGSFVYHPPWHAHEPLPGVVPKATRVVVDGWQVDFVELQGWIRTADCGDGQDYNYGLELDTDWAMQQGINLHHILRVGNVVHAAIPETPAGEHKSVSLPLIKLELDAWGRDDRVHGGASAVKPPDWATPGCNGITFPWDPIGLLQGAPLPQLGTYVRATGTLVTDWNHCCAETISCSDWSPGVDYRSASHLDRWTEVHPLNLIEKATEPPNRVTTRAIAVLASPNTCEDLEVDLSPDVPQPAQQVLAWSASVGPETIWPYGQNASNNHWVTSFPDHIHVRVRICSPPVTPFAPFRFPGKFKAIYRLWWQQALKQMVLTVQDQRPQGSAPAAQGTVTVTARDASTNTLLSGSVTIRSKNGTTFTGQTGKPIKYSCVMMVGGHPARAFFCPGTVTVPGYQSATFVVNKLGP